MMHWIIACLARGAQMLCPLAGGSPTLSDECTAPCTATVRIRLLRGGTWDTLGGGGSGDWILAACQTGTIGDDYEAEMVINTGDNPTSGTAFGGGTWTTVNTTLDWTWTTSVVGGLDATFTLTIREKADTSNTASWSGSAHTLVE